MLRCSALLLTLVASLAACGKTTLDDDITALRGQLNGGDYEAVVAAAPAVLQRAQAEGTEPQAWSVEKIQLEATAKSGDGAGTDTLLKQLDEQYPGKVTAILYAQMGGFVADGGDLTGAITVLDEGRKKFPDMGDKFDPYIENIKAMATAGGDAEAIERLKSLGYL